MPIYNKFYVLALKVFDRTEKNEVKSADLILLALKNLSAKKNRTFITIGGMAIGFGAVILLLSLGYGFERLVVSQVASLAEIKQIDITTTQGSPLSFSYEMREGISLMDEVEVVLPVITAVSRVNYNNAVSDVIVYGVTTRYLHEAGLSALYGEFYQDEVQKNSSTVSKESEGDVAGISTRLVSSEVFDNEIYKIEYSLYPDTWYSVYSEPNEDSKLLGYTKRGLGNNSAIEVWGFTYEGVDLEREARDYMGNKYAPWVKDYVLLWERKECSLESVECVDFEYVPIKPNESHLVEEGYIKENDIAVERFQISKHSGLDLKLGDMVEQVSFSLPEKSKTDMYFDFDEDSIRVSVFNEKVIENYNGSLVYGSPYDDPDESFGYWIKVELDLWSEEVCDDMCYVYYLENVLGNYFENTLIGYFKIEDVVILGSEDSLKDDSELNSGSGKVLGLATGEGENSNFVDISELSLIDDGIDWAQITSELGMAETVEVDTKPLPETAQRVALVNTSMLNLLGLSIENAVGEEFESTFVYDSKLFNKTNYLVESEKASYKIVGVVSDTGSPTFYVPYNDMLVNGIESVSNIKVVIYNTDDVGTVRRYIENLGFQTHSVVDTVARISSIFDVVRTALLLLGLIALSVASLGMFNTLTVSLLEKTREVGLLKTMGMKSTEIKVLFLAESVIMSVMGGFFGILLGFLIGRLISFLVSMIAISQGHEALDIAYIPAVLAIIIIVLSLIVGVITGWYPAKRATKISALNALRYE